MTPTGSVRTRPDVAAPAVSAGLLSEVDAFQEASRQLAMLSQRTVGRAATTLKMKADICLLEAIASGGQVAVLSLAPTGTGVPIGATGELPQLPQTGGAR